MNTLFFSTLPKTATITKTVLILGVVILFGLTNACRPITDPTNTPEEVLPNLIMLTLVSNQDTVRASWLSTTNVQGTASVVNNLILQSGRSYKGRISVVNNVRTPNVDLTAEYLKEADKHQFFYLFSSSVQPRIILTTTDKDNNNLPLGIEFTFEVRGTGFVEGTLNIVLSHYDDVKKTGNNRSPESDIDITIPVVVL